MRIGFREARFTLDGFFLNGRRVKLFGADRHQFFPFAGGAMPARVQARDAEIMRRELNCTMVRCSHYPQAEAFFDACDELGLMAWEEAPGWGYLGDDAWKALAYRDIGEMIVRDRNHPSIIVWGARLNETPNDTAFYTSTNELAHALDDSRPTAGAMAGMRLTTDYQQDVFGEDDYSSVKGPDGLKEPVLQPPVSGAGKPYLVSEAVGTLSGPAIYYRRTDAQAVQQGQATAHARVHDLAASDDRYCGLLAWSGFDYPSGSGNQYRGVKYTGVVDLFRIPKPGAAIYQAQADPRVRPVIAPAFYWDFGPQSPVSALPAAMICANLDRLEVYVGGGHFATLTPDRAGYPHLRLPALVRRFPRGGRLGPSRAAHRRLPRRRQGGVAVACPATRRATCWRWPPTTPRSTATARTPPGWSSARPTATARPARTSPARSRSLSRARRYWSATTRSTSPRRAAPARSGSAPGPASRARSRSGPATPAWAARSRGSASAAGERQLLSGQCQPWPRAPAVTRSSSCSSARSATWPSTASGISRCASWPPPSGPATGCSSTTSGPRRACSWRWSRRRRTVSDGCWPTSFGTESPDLVALGRHFWRQLRSPELAPLIRLFFELYAQALQGRVYARPILAGFPGSWVEPVLPAVMAAGLTEAEARAEARLGIAVIRGLLLDVLATGDVAGADAAHEAYLAALSARMAQREPPPSPA